MRKVFLFWSVIFIVLITGTAAIIYGKLLLKEEEKKADEIIRELSLPKVRKAPGIPVAEIKEAPADVKESKPVLPPDAESLKAPVDTKLPEVPKSEAAKPPSPPNIPEQADIESAETPEQPITPPMPPIGQ